MKTRASFIGNESNIDSVYIERVKRELSELADFNPYIISRDNLEEHSEALQKVEVLFSTWGMIDLSGEEIAHYLPNLRAVFYAAGSVQHFARPFLARGVKVVSAWSANAVPVAEYTVAQILLANKGFYQAVAMCKISQSAASEYAQSFPGNFGAKVGLLGAGMIGRKVIELLKPYQLEVVVFDPFLPDEEAARLGVQKGELIELFSTCQTVSNHLANLPATEGILHKEHFDRMLPNATFINTGRGKQVVEDDLIKALRVVPTRTALLDVTYPEPVEAGSGLLTLDNVILTPHIAGSNKVESGRMAEYVRDEFRRYLKGEPLLYEVSLKMLETMA